MARIAGVNIPDNKHVEYSLCYIKGIGAPLAIKICQMADIKLGTKVSELSEAEIEAIIADAINTTGANSIKEMAD